MFKGFREIFKSNRAVVVVDERLKDFIPKLNELTDEDVISPQMRHLISSLRHEDYTRNSFLSTWSMQMKRKDGVMVL